MKRDYRFKYGQGPIDDEPDDIPPEEEEPAEPVKPPPMPFSPSVKVDMKKKVSDPLIQKKLTSLQTNNDGSLSFNVVEESK